MNTKLLLSTVLFLTWTLPLKAEYIAGKNQASSKLMTIINENGMEPFYLHDVLKRTLHKIQQGFMPKLGIRETSPQNLEVSCKDKSLTLNTPPEIALGDLLDQLQPFLNECLDPDPLNEDLKEKLSISEAYESFILEQLVPIYDARGRYYKPNPIDSIYQDGATGAVGLVLKSVEGKIYVVSTVPGSPAQKNGVRPGDQILKIGMDDVATLSPEIAALKLRGFEGTAVEITLVPKEGGQPKIVKLVRENMAVKSVSSRIDGTLGILKVSSFDPTTLIDFDLALNNFVQRASTGVILDLRNNDGGLLETAIAMADRFLPPNQVMLSIKGKQPQEFKSTEKSNRITLPLVILVNQKTASAAEALAASLQDLGRATVIGERTAGRGAVRTVYTINDRYKLELTVALAMTPKSKSIDGIGVQPNKPVPEGAYAYDSSLPDPLLKVALDHLNTKTPTPTPTSAPPTQAR